MLSVKENIHLSKLLSYILRHKPGEYGIVLDENGYTNVDELINKLNAHNENINLEILQYIVDTNSKKRFEFNDDLTKIRARVIQLMCTFLLINLQTPLFFQGYNM